MTSCSCRADNPTAPCCEEENFVCDQRGMFTSAGSILCVTTARRMSPISLLKSSPRKSRLPRLQLPLRSGSPSDMLRAFQLHEVLCFHRQRVREAAGQNSSAARRYSQPVRAPPAPAEGCPLPAEAHKPPRGDTHRLLV